LADRKSPLSAVLDDPLVEGTKRLASRFGRYVGSGDAFRDSAKLAVRVAPDMVAGGLPRVLQNQVAKPMVESLKADFKANPGRTVAENTPIIGDIMSVRDAADMRKKALEARARGDMEGYRKYSELAAMVAGATMAGAIPIPAAKAAKVGTKAAIKAAERGAVRDVAGMAEKYGVEAEGIGAPAIIKSESGAARRAPSEGVDREKLRERYPDPAPPEQKWDKNKGQFYEGKGSDTPEIQALTKVRKQATADIKAGNYTPIFDASKRDYVDPADYPLSGSTLLDTLPTREATTAKWREKAQDPEALRRLEAGFLTQQGNPDAEHWYAMLQLQQAYVQMYGPEKGREMFKRYFADSMAGTTGGADPATNFLTAGYLNHLDATGAPTPLKGYDIPYPIGGGKHGAMGNVVLGRKFMDNPEMFTTAGNPKRFNFKGNFLGHRNKATIDEQMMGAWDPTGKTAQPQYYGLYEQPVHDLAAKYGVEPANFQDVTWAGLKTEKTPNFKPHPMISVVNEAVERTSRVLGISPDEALQHILSGGPVYAKGGLVEKYDA
jgi:hypothetical protein